MPAKNLIRAAALLMFLCAVLHTLAWKRTEVDFAPEVRPMVALLWFLIGIDWVVIAGLWVIGAAQGAVARNQLLLSSLVPIAVAIGLLLTIGPGFFPVYLQLGAAALLMLGAIRLT